MNRSKKILSLLFKLGLGIACVYLVYSRLKNELGWEQMALLKNILLKPDSIAVLVFCLLLIPVNWGIESRKWQLITKSVEPIALSTAMRSIYSGICVGNFAPGRATEFLGKILFFSDENKGKITVLHFVNGMIQLSITLIVGLIALRIKLHTFSNDYEWLFYLLFISGVCLIVLFAIAVLRVNFFLDLVSKVLSRFIQSKNTRVSFPLKLWLRLFSLSILRYLTFTLQFYLLLNLLSVHLETAFLLPGIALYFMMSSLLPMVSVLEAAIRAAIALIVLSDSGLSSTSLALATVLLWLFNIAVPSIIGYIILLGMKFDFKLIYKKKL